MDATPGRERARTDGVFMEIAMLLIIDNYDSFTYNFTK